MIFEFGPGAVLRRPQTRSLTQKRDPAGPKVYHWRQGPKPGGKSFQALEPSRRTPLLTRTPDPLGSADSKGLRPLPPTPRENNVCTRLCVFPFALCVAVALPRLRPQPPITARKTKIPRQADAHRIMKLGLSQWHVRAPLTAADPEKI